MRYPIENIGRPLARRVTFYVVLTSTAFAILSSVFQLYIEFQRDVGHVHSTLDLVQTSNLSSIAADVWALDTNEVQVTVDAISQLPHVEYVAVYENGELVATGGANSNENIVEKRYQLTYVFDGEQHEIGELFVKATLNEAYANVMSSALVILFSNMAKTLVVSGLILLLFYALVGRHLSALAIFAERLDLDNLDVTFEFKRKKKRSSADDELDVVGNAIGTMQKNLSASTKNLRKSEARFRELAESLPESVFETNLDHRLTYANRRTFEVFGITPHDIETGIDGFSLVAPRERERSNEIAQRRMSGENVGAVEYEMLRHDGTTFPGLVHLNRVQVDGEVTGFRGIIFDITEHKRMLTEPAEFMARASAVVENSVDGIITIDESGIIESLNRAGALMFGYDPEEVVGRNVKILMPEPDRSRNDAHLDRYCRYGEKHILGTARELTAIRKDGTTFPMRLSVAEVTFEERRIFSGSIHDLSHERELEQKLFQSQKLESLGTLAGGIAHDFNNILQSILGFVEIATKEAPADSELLTQSLETIHEGGRRAADLVDQILAFSRNSPIELEEVDICATLENALRFIRSAVPSTINIESSMASDMPVLTGNSTKIYQVITNLCTNALHAMEAEGGTLKVSLQAITLSSGMDTLSGSISSGEYVELTVADTGSGIAPGVMDSILDPFFTTKEVGKGTGLGLSMVHGIITDMSGGLKIESVEGQGTTVRVFMPVAPDVSLEQPSDAIEQPTAPEYARILLVDDEASITKLATYILESRGLTVEVFNDPLSAATMVAERSGEFDLAIVDYTMPRMNGTQLAAEFQKTSPDMPVIIATGMIDSQAIESGCPDNVMHILRKPYNSGALTESVQKALAGTKKNRNAGQEM